VEVLVRQSEALVTAQPGKKQAERKRRVAVYQVKNFCIPAHPADPSCVWSDLLNCADIDIRSIVYASEAWARTQATGQLARVGQGNLRSQVKYVSWVLD